jgi:hypothetical protein
MARRDRELLFFALVLISGGTAEPAFAVDLSGAYVGGNFGRAQNQYDTGFIDGQIMSEAASAGGAATFTARSVRKLSDVWWINAGYFLNSYVGFDAAYLHLGVESQHVVPAESETIDGWLTGEAHVGPVPVIAMKPGR